MATIINADQRQQIRKNPDMYGPIKNPNHMVQEAMDNAIDQVIAGHATHIIVCIHNDGSASVMDNGKGIPFTLTKNRYRRKHANRSYGVDCTQLVKSLQPSRYNITW